MEILNNKENKDNKADRVVIQLFNDLVSEIEAQIISGKIINLQDFDKDIDFIKNKINRYNNFMNEWYDSDYLFDKNNLLNIFEKFNNQSNIYKELSFVIINDK